MTTQPQPIPSILSTLGTALKSEETNAAAALLQFFSGSLISWGVDEAKILGDAVNTMIEDLQAGKTWEEAATDTYNGFYNEELAEGQKIALQFLTVISTIAQTAQAIL